MTLFKYLFFCLAALVPLGLTAQQGVVNCNFADINQTNYHTLQQLSGSTKIDTFAYWKCISGLASIWFPSPEKSNCTNYIQLVSAPTNSRKQVLIAGLKGDVCNSFYSDITLNIVVRVNKNDSYSPKLLTMKFINNDSLIKEIEISLKGVTKDWLNLLVPVSINSFLTHVVVGNSVQKIKRIKSGRFTLPYIEIEKISIICGGNSPCCFSCDSSTYN